MTTELRQRILWWLKLALGVASLVVIAVLVEPARIFEALKSARPLYLVAAAVLILPNLWFQQRKWKLLAVKLNPSHSNSAAWRSLLGGFALGIITPARIGEFGGRLLFDKELQSARALGMIAVDKFVAMLVTVAAGTVAFGLWGLHMDFFGITTSILVIAAGLFFPFFIWKEVRRLSGNASQGEGASKCRFAATVQRVANGVALISTSEVRLLVLYSALFYITFILQFVLLVTAFVPADFLYVILAAACMMGAKTVVPPITVAELGIREGFAIFFLGAIGIASATAFSASILLFSMNILLPAALGGIIILRSSLQS